MSALCHSSLPNIDLNPRRLATIIIKMDLALISGDFSFAFMAKCRSQWWGSFCLRVPFQLMGRKGAVAINAITVHYSFPFISSDQYFVYVLP